MKDKKYKIILIGTAFPYRGGIAHFMETMFHGLQSRGHQASMITFTRQYPKILFPGKTQYLTEPVEQPPPTIRLIDSVNPLSWARTARFIINEKPDAIIFKYWMPFFAPAYGYIARRVKKRGIRIISIVHNALPHEKHVGDKQISKYFINTCDALIAMSDAVVTDIQSLTVNSKIYKVDHPLYNIFGNPIEQKTAREKLQLAESIPLLLFFGFIREYKGLHVLLKAMPRIIKDIPDVQLVVGGEFYKDEAAYLELIDKLNIRDHLILHTHYIPESDVSAYFSAADLVVQPYISATQSGVAKIAYHFEKPIVVTDVGGLAETVLNGKTGFVVPPNDFESLANTIITFFRKQLSDKCIQGVKQEKKKYSWDNIYKVIEDELNRKS